MPKILLVEPSSELRESIAAGLRGERLEVITSHHAELLLPAVRRCRPDLVIFDLGSPSDGGLPRLAQLRAQPASRRLPIILLAQHADRPLVQHLLRLGIRDLILRGPQAPAAVLARVAQRLCAAAAAAPEPAEAATAVGPAPAPPRAPTPRPAPRARAKPATLAPAIPPLSAAMEMLRLLTPALPKSELLSRVDKGVELRALSPIVHQVAALADSPQSSVDSITKAIKQDPAVCVKILKVANSALYAGSGPVDNVHKAVMRIGLGQIRQAVGSLAVMDRFGDTALGERISAQEFWEHSIACGLLAAAIARARGHTDEDADGHFITGLLHDVGRVIYAGELGEHYARVLDESDRLALPVELLEMRLLGVNHAEIAERVLRAWKFPPHLVNPIAMHHLSLGTLRSTAPRAVSEVATLALADRLAHCLMLGRSGNDAAHPARDLATALGMSPELVARLAAEVPDQAADLRISLLARSGAPSPVIDPPWRRLLPPKSDLRLAYLSTQPVLDGLGFLCQRLGPREEHEPPTAVLAYAANPKEQAPIAASLRALEQEHGTDSLPLVILSPAGNLSLDPALDRSRRCAQLPAPVHLVRLAAALREVLDPSEPPPPSA